MGYERKVWKNRISEYPNRRKLTNTETDEELLVTVERDEGTISQEGDKFDADTMNDLENRIERGLITSGSGKPCITMIDRWLRFNPNNKKGLIIKAGTKIKINEDNDYYVFEEDTEVDLSSYITQNGAEYFVYMDAEGNVSAQITENPNLIKLGRFHTLCVNAGNITMTAPASPSSGMVVGGKYLVKSYLEKYDEDFYNFYNKNITAVTVQTYYDLITCQHPLSGFNAGDILPESVFCLTFHPECLHEDAQVYDKDTNKVIDIYLQSGTGFNTKSVYNATHTVNRQPHNHREDFRMVGKRMLRDCEFTSAALGSNESTNIVGSSDKTTVGGHTDTAGRRMISAIGCEEMCGYLWQWLDEVGFNGQGNWSATDGHGSFGQEFGVPYVLLAGGDWHNSSGCGSRCRICNHSRSIVDSNDGGRGLSRISYQC